MKTGIRFAALARFAAHPLARLAGIGLLAGGATFLVIGDTPASSPLAVSGSESFELPAALLAAPTAPPSPGQPVWASEPAAAAEEAVLVPPPRLIAVVSSAGERLAVFEWPDGRRVRIGAEMPLEGEGVIETISPTGVRWRRADGTLVEATLFIDPTPRVVSPG